LNWNQFPAALPYRAERLLYRRLDPEGGVADVLEAEVLRERPGDDPELAEASGFGDLHERDLGTPRHHHRGARDPGAAGEELLLAKVLQPLRRDEGGSAARGAVADVGAAFGKLSAAPTLLVPGREDDGADVRKEAGLQERGGTSAARSQVGVGMEETKRLPQWRNMKHIDFYVGRQAAIRGDMVSFVWYQTNTSSLGSYTCRPMGVQDFKPNVHDQTLFLNLGA